jgi:hypothetical protein
VCVGLLFKEGFGLVDLLRLKSTFSVPPVLVLKKLPSFNYNIFVLQVDFDFEGLVLLLAVEVVVDVDYVMQYFLHWLSFHVYLFMK